MHLFLIINKLIDFAGPQDGTLLVTWHPILTPHHPGSTITGYAVYADGKKVTDVDSPTGDHALIDISKLLGLNPKHVTVRTKARDSQSADSLPTPIPISVLRGGVKARQQPHSAVMPAHIRQQMPRQQQQQQGQQVCDQDSFVNTYVYWFNCDRSSNLTRT
jgi:RIMS-binding protein 2